MESHDSYPVFHTRLIRTQRRRRTRSDGTPGGWLIYTDGTYTEVPVKPAKRDDPPQLAIPSPR